jgi:hypothetical protein
MKNRDNAITTTIKFAQKFTAVKNNVLAEQLYQHPHYPSLLSISEVLQFEGVQNFAAKINSQDLTQITFPIMAHLHIKGGVFVVLQKLINNQISYWLDGKVIQESVETFSTKWSNAVLIPEIEETKKISFISNQKIKIAFILTLCTFLISLLIWNAASLTLLSPILFSGQAISLILGLAVAVLIILQSIDQRNPLVQQLCGGGTKIDCNHILSSKAAKINSWLGWADVGLFYYAGSFLLLMSSHSTTAIITLCLFNVISLPFTFYSVYYQWKVAKSWCRLCLYVQALLWVQASFSFYYLFQLTTSPYLNIFDLLKTLTIFLLPAFVWLLVKPYLQDLKQIAPLKKQLNRLKFDTETFKFHLLKQAKYVAPADISFVVGNPTSLLEITMVSNPFCNPCAKAHEMLDEWLNKGLDFKLNIVFMPGGEKELKYQFIHHLFALKTQDINIAKQALHTWFATEKRELQEWKNKFPASENTTVALSDLLVKQNDWCKLAEISATPTFLINGYKVPENYQLRDLKYILMNWDN